MCIDSIDLIDTYCTEHDASEVTRHKCPVQEILFDSAPSSVLDIENIRHNQYLVRTIVLATVHNNSSACCSAAQL